MGSIVFDQANKIANSNNNRKQHCAKVDYLFSIRIESERRTRLKCNLGCLASTKLKTEEQTCIFASHSYIFAILTIAGSVKPVLI